MIASALLEEDGSSTVSGLKELVAFHIAVSVCWGFATKSLSDALNRLGIWNSAGSAVVVRDRFLCGG
jgi:hypothetical protein